MSFYYHTDYKGNEGSYLDKFGDINKISIEDIFSDEDLLDDIHENNYDLVEAITIPKITEDIKNIILQPSESDDDYKKYKVPYLAANCFSILPEKQLQEIVKDGSFLDSIFNIVFDDSTSEMRLGLFIKIFYALAKKVPKELYNYLIEHDESISTKLSEHMKYHSIVEIARYLLDFPYSKPWWKNPDSFLQLFLNSLANPESSSGISLFFISIIYRATSCVNNCEYKLSLTLLPYMITDSFLGGLFDIIMKSEDENVIYNVFSIFSRLLWKELPTMDYGLGGYYSAIDKKYYGETTQIEGIIDDKSRSFVLQFLEGKVLMIYNKLNELMKVEDVEINGLDKNVKMKRCPKSILGIVEFYQFYYKAIDSNMIDNNIMDIVNSLIIVAEHYSYNAYLHHNIVEVLTTLIMNQDYLKLLVNNNSFLEFLSRDYNSSNFCLRNLSHLLLSPFLTQCQQYSFYSESNSSLWAELLQYQSEEVPQHLGENQLGQSGFLSSGSMVRELIENASILLEQQQQEQDRMKKEGPCDLDEFDIASLPVGESATPSFSLPELPLTKDSIGDDDDDLDFSAISTNDLMIDDPIPPPSFIPVDGNSLNDSLPTPIEIPDDALLSISNEAIPPIPLLPEEDIESPIHKSMPSFPSSFDMTPDSPPIPLPNSSSFDMNPDSPPIPLPNSLTSSCTNPLPSPPPFFSSQTVLQIHDSSSDGSAPEVASEDTSDGSAPEVASDDTSDGSAPEVASEDDMKFDSIPSFSSIGTETDNKKQTVLQSNTDESPIPTLPNLPPPPPFPQEDNSPVEVQMLTASLNSVHISSSIQEENVVSLEKQDSFKSINSDDINSLPYSCQFQEDITQEDFPNLNNLPESSM